MQNNVNCCVPAAQTTTERPQLTLLGQLLGQFKHRRRGTRDGGDAGAVNDARQNTPQRARKQHACAHLRNNFLQQWSSAACCVHFKSTIPSPNSRVRPTDALPATHPSVFGWAQAFGPAAAQLGLPLWPSGTQAVTGADRRATEHIASTLRKLGTTQACASSFSSSILSLGGQPDSFSAGLPR